MNLNKAMIIGNLTRDPEIRTTPNGQTVASFSVATNFIWKDQSGQQQKRVEFHNVVVWRKLAEICGQYLKKGSKAYFEGRLQTSDWVGQDGVKRYKTDIVADNMIMLDRPANQSNQFSGGINEASLPSENNMSTQQTESEPVINIDEPTQTEQNSNNSDEEEIKVENIPF